MFGVLIADGERLYDPRIYHDRLLLGLSGIMSEAELHQIRMRLHQGERQKAARGELRLPLPAGLAHDRAGAIILNPDEEVRARIHLVFAKFRELQSARAVMRFLRANGLPLPVRPVLGPSPHDVVWREADSARVRNILQNPAYAGAYVYGRRQRDPSRCRPGSVRATVKVASRIGRFACRPLIPVTSAGRSSWPTSGDWPTTSTDTRRDTPARPRKGSALLQGIAICGRCGRRMSLRYTGPNGDYPVYCCRSDRDQQGVALCQEVRALPIDAFVEGVLLDALAPDQIAIAIAAVGQLEEESRQLERQWALRRERARYEAERARRQYDAVEPENRLVARSLERAWEEKLRAVEAIDQEHARWRSEEPLVLARGGSRLATSAGRKSPADLACRRRLHAADRKRILRFVIREVILDQKRLHGQVWLKILWQTGATSEHCLQRRVHAYRDYVRSRWTATHGLRSSTPPARWTRRSRTILNQEGFVAARGCAFKGGNVWLLRTRWDIPTVKINGVDANPPRWPDGSFSIQGAAAALGVTPQTIFDYLARGLLAGHQLTKGHLGKSTLDGTNR